jgi:YD repeat-containing protein
VRNIYGASGDARVEVQDWSGPQLVSPRTPIGPPPLPGTYPPPPRPSAGEWHTLWQANAYDPFGRVRQARLGSGVVEERTFEPSTGLVDALHVGADLVQQSYGFDANGNLVRRDDPDTTSEEFEYDDLDRLERWIRHRPA